MPKLFSTSQQHRHNTGNHNHWQDKNSASQRQQDEYIRQLAQQPGRHTANASRYDVTRTAVQLLSILSAVQNLTFTPAIIQNEAKEVQPISRQQAGDTIADSPHETRTNSTGLSTLCSVRQMPRLSAALPESWNTKSRRHYRRHASQAASPQWLQSNSNLVRFLKKQGAMDDSKPLSECSKEEVVAAVASWIFDPDAQGVTQPQRHVKKIAKFILASSGLYGGSRPEMITHNQAEATFRNWFFSNMMGTSLSEYLARTTALDPRPSYITVSSIKQLVSLEKLHQDGRLDITKIPVEKWGALNAMWFSWLSKEMPFLDYPGAGSDGTAIDSLEFADLYSGCRYLADNDRHNTFNRIDAILAGRKMWDLAIDDGIETYKLPYFLLPSLLFMASNTPEKINGKHDIYSISAQSVNDYIRYRENIRAAQQDITHKCAKYRDTVGEWLSKSRLADKIISACPSSQLPSLHDIPDNIPNAAQRRAKEASSLYMNGVARPCPGAPESLTDEYQKLTTKVADSFREIDNYLIWSAIGNIEKEDAAFITSPDADIHPVSFSMRTNRMNIPAYGYLHDNNFNVALDKTDLFSVSVRNEERIYALKGNNGSYEIFRVDRNIVRYIESGLLDYKKFGIYHKEIGNKIKTNKEEFTYSFFSDKHTLLSYDGNAKLLVAYLSMKHHGNIYTSLYEAGNDKTDIQQIWNVVKYMIPFYQCVQGIINNDPVEAVPSCLLDVIAFIPLFGQAARMGGNFGKGLASGLRSGKIVLDRGTAAGATQAFIREVSLPSATELTSLAENSLKTLDPGFELLAGGGKKFAEKLIYQLSKEERGAAVAKKLAASELLSQPPVSRGLFISARLPDSEISVPVKKVASDEGHDVYVMVNPDTGEMAGRRFSLSPDSEHLRYYFPHKHKLANAQPAPVVHQGIANLNRVPGLRRFLPSMNSIHLPQLQLRDVTENIHRKVVHSYQLSHIYIHSYSDRAENIPPEFSYLTKNIVRLKSEITRAIEIATSVRDQLKSIYFFTPEGGSVTANKNNFIKTYIGQALNTRSSAVIDQSIQRLSDYLTKICDYFTAHQSDILLATARREEILYIPLPYTPNGFTFLNDQHQRIVLMVDRFEGFQMFNNDLPTTVLHEASHASGTSGDFFMSAHVANVGEARDIVESLDEILDGTDQEATFSIDEQFVSAYAQRLNIPKPTEAQFLELIRRDPMLKANIIIDNADTLANIINDIYRESVSLGISRRRRDEEKYINNEVQKTLLSLITRNLNPLQRTSAKVKVSELP